MGLFSHCSSSLRPYLGPTTLFGDLAEDHVELIIAVLALITSVPSMLNSGLLRIPQSFA